MTVPKKESEVEKGYNCIGKMFPKKERLIVCPRCEAILEVNEEGLAREAEWWELLMWSNMKNTFKRLPPELRNKIRLKFGRKEIWMYDDV